MMIKNELINILKDITVSVLEEEFIKDLNWNEK